MLFSKSFGYAVRSILFIAAKQKEKQTVRIDEITSTLGLPRQFMGRVLKILARENILISHKGPSGGFSISDEGLQTPLIRIMEITSDNRLENCILKKKKCDPENVCPVHDHFSKIRADLILVMSQTTIRQLLKNRQANFLTSLSELSARRSY